MFNVINGKYNSFFHLCFYFSATIAIHNSLSSGDSSEKICGEFQQNDKKMTKGEAKAVKNQQKVKNENTIKVATLSAETKCCH